MSATARKTESLGAPAFSYHGFRYRCHHRYEECPKGGFHRLYRERLDGYHRTYRDFLYDINKVLKNAWWGIYGNYKGMPVDCPQRNERQPWLGDRKRWGRWAKVSFSTISDSTASGCTISAMPSVRMAISRMWLLPFWNYYTGMMSPGWQPCLSPVICSIISLETSSLHHRFLSIHQEMDQPYPGTIYAAEERHHHQG